jgi:hypothetical protein
MSFPDALDLATALESGKATKEQVNLAAERLRQFFQLAKTQEANVESFRTARDTAVSNLAEREVVLGEMIHTAANTINQKEQELIEKTNRLSNKDVEIQTLTQLMADKTAELSTKESMIIVKESELTVVSQELTALKAKPEVIKVLDEEKAKRIIMLKAELAELEPKEEPIGEIEK